MLLPSPSSMRAAANTPAGPAGALVAHFPASATPAGRLPARFRGLPTRVAALGMVAITQGGYTGVVVTSFIRSLAPAVCRAIAAHPPASTGSHALRAASGLAPPHYDSLSFRAVRLPSHLVSSPCPNPRADFGLSSGIMRLAHGPPGRFGHAGGYPRRSADAARLPLCIPPRLRRAVEPRSRLDNIEPVPVRLLDLCM